MGDFLKGYKGFKKGLVCKDKQYKENTVFEEDEAVICKKGMHFCVNPFDVLDHYDLVNEDGTFNDFAEVEALSDSKTNDDKKYCTTKLKIGAKLSFSGFVNACVNFVMEKTKIEDVSIEERIKNPNLLNDNGLDSAQIGSSGDSAQIGSSGDSAKIGSSGDSAKIGSSGDFAKIGSSGDSAQIDSSGESSVICCAGRNSIAKAKKGSWITLSEWEYSNEKGRYIPVCVKTEYVDGENIKEDTFYKLINGKFTECN